MAKFNSTMPNFQLGRTVSEPITKVMLDDNSAGLGLASKYLVDVQRFLACKKILRQEHLSDTKIAKELNIVVGNTKAYSAHSKLMFRSHNQLRLGWWVPKLGM